MSLLTGCIIGAIAVFIILNVISVSITRKRGMDAPQDRISRWCLWIIMPTVILLHIVWFFITIIPRPLSKEEKAFKERERVYKEEIAGLTDDEIMFRGGRKTFHATIKQFEFEYRMLDPKDPVWDEQLRKDILPDGANLLMELAIDASTNLAYLQTSPLSAKVDLSLEQNSLEMCFENLKSVLVDHVHQSQDHAEDFIVHELDKAMEKDNTYRTEPIYLPNLACPYFGIVDENYKKSINSGEI